MAGQLDGQQIGRYLIRQRLGGGGVATVYQAYDQVSGQTVALKVLPPNPDPTTLDRFWREAKQAGALRHPNIVRILQVGSTGEGSSAYLAMDLVEGESLAELLTRFGQLRAEESCLLLEPIARALAFAHAHGVVHRDVKPSNILLRPVSFRPDQQNHASGVNLDVLQHPVVPLLSDFGIARYMDSPELTSEGRTVGTPAFMAPEQCMGSRDVDGRADIYSLGMVLYRSIVGQLPFNGSPTQILYAHVYEPVVIDKLEAKHSPPRVLEILRRSLAKAPEARYQSADELANELAAVGRDMATLPPAVNAVNTTTTMTIETAATTTGNMPREVVVLVPGTIEKQIVEKQSTVPAKVETARTRGPSRERILWAAFFILLIAGGGWWSARSWLGGSGGRGERPLSLPPVILVTNTPDLPSSGAAITPTATVESVVVAASNTPAPTELPTEAPTATSSPLPPATATLPPPTELPTQAPIVVEAPTPTTVPTTTPTTMPTPVASEVITPGEELAITCSMVADEFLLPKVAELTGELQTDFACPTEAVEVVTGEWMAFEGGAMVAVVGSPLVYVYYADGSWEQVPRETSSLPSTPEGEGSEPEVLPPPFGAIYAVLRRNLQLGAPLQAAPMQSETVLQSFVGGLAVGNKSDGRVLFLARSKLRF